MRLLGVSPAALEGLSVEEEEVVATCPRDILWPSNLLGIALPVTSDIINLSCSHPCSPLGVHCWSFFIHSGSIAHNGSILLALQLSSHSSRLKSNRHSSYAYFWISIYVNIIKKK